MLVHCNKGKHRTGCLIGCFRKVSPSSYLQSSVLKMTGLVCLPFPRPFKAKEHHDFRVGEYDFDCGGGKEGIVLFPLRV